MGITSSSLNLKESVNVSVPRKMRTKAGHKDVEQTKEI